MYKVLIVDDEIAVIEGLEATIPWDQLKIDVIATACSVEEALAEMRRQPADIVISDIRMPGMSGLDFIREIKRIWAQTRCILISGHSEFQYAQTAIKNGAEDYLLKPVRDEDMIHAVQTAVDHLYEEQRILRSHDQVLKTLGESLPLLRSQFLNEILQGKPYTESMFEEKLNQLQIPFLFHVPSVLLLVRLETEESRNDLQVLQLSVIQIAQEILGASFSIWPCIEWHDYVILLAQQQIDHLEAQSYEQALQSSHALLQSLVIKLQGTIMSRLKFPVSLVVSDWHAFPSNIPHMYQSLLRAVRQHSSHDQGLLLALKEPRGLQPLPMLKTLYEPPFFLHFLEAGRWDAARDKLASIFEEMVLVGEGQSEMLLEVFLHISHAYSFITHKQGRLLYEVIGADYERFDSGLSFYSVHQLQEWSYRLLDKISAEMSSEAKTSRRYVAEQVQKYIQEHLSEDISLQTLADLVQLHPVYVSRIFKLETDEKLSDYILRLKMEKALHLLFHEDLKVYQIAEQLGYFNTPYFIQVFKKYYSCTPQEYRDSAAGKKAP